jgi:hypothetical protein
MSENKILSLDEFKKGLENAISEKTEAPESKAEPAERQ